VSSYHIYTGNNDELYYRRLSLNAVHCPDKNTVYMTFYKLATSLFSSRWKGYLLCGGPLDEADQK